MNFKSLLILAIASFSFSYSSFVVAKYTPEQVKAVYLFRIASFIHWVDENNMVEVRYCVPDNKRIKELLISITAGKLIRELPITVTENSCDILFVSDKSNLALVQSSEKHTVTVGDITRFTANGGAIELENVNGKIKPRVNLDNIGDYSISSNFLRVATVEGGENERP